MLYDLVFRSVFRRMDPELAHHLGMTAIRVLGSRPIAPVVRRFAAPDPRLETTALGRTFPTPFGVAAGFDKNAVGVRGVDALGFGHVEIGTVTAIPQPGNERPRLFRLVADRGLLNRMGFNNEGARAAARRIARLRRRGAVVGANIGKSRVVAVEDATADYVRSARALAPVADYLAVNVSSPNTPGLRGLQAVETLRPLLEAVRDASGGTPLLVKIAPDLPDDEVAAIAHLAVDLGLDGLIATNTTISRDGLATPQGEVERMGAGGVSGPPVKARSLEVLRLVREAAPDPSFCVISVGGVETGADVRERLDAGATLVQGYTGFIYRGPLWAREINRALAA
ncbi:quinone-dependent dihydroorotate dehydrogenase [Microbacterium excoecariae]|uniref:quinone-dependent dihydroorotate dehydrogenase n=1 Tax=Microbacterium excoecariae TaxID=2715210 RepID=UPI0014079DEA|nr:quinone-dependent dihydroorotate dehydrogenase [Microbacterium excoecariae]NHI16659.1 quinone-dependent dihydroorotate dehydrogenase [Microbacterium excoecariae]